MNLNNYLAELEECGAIYAITINDDFSKALALGLKPEYFADRHRRMAFESARELVELGKDVTIRNVVEHLKATRKISIQDIQAITIMDFKGHDKYYHGSKAKYYAETLHKTYINREAQQAVIQYYSDLDTMDSYTASIKLISVIDYLSQTIQSDDFIQISKKAIEQAEKIRQIATGEFTMQYSQTWIKSLDKIIGGFYPKQYITLAARPGQGKSLLALQMALNMASKQIPVAYVTLEMSTEEQVNRCLSNRTGIATKDIKKAKYLNAEQMKSLQEQAYKFDKMPLYFNDEPMVDTQKIESYVRELKKKGVQGIFIDMIQLLQPNSGDRSKAKTEQVTNISKHLKAIAKRNNIWIVNIAAMNRDVDKSNRKPKISDIRESGQIESDSDLVLMLFRPNFDPNSPPEENSSEEIELIIGKNRDGGTGTINLLAEWHLCRFKEVEAYHTNTFNQRTPF